MDEEDALRGSRWRAWALADLERAGWTKQDQPTVRYIVDQFMGMGVILTHGGTDDFSTAVLIVTRLLEGRSIADTGPTAPGTGEDPAHVWVRVQPGQTLNRQDRVRVAPDAYTGDQVIHNGREGVVMGVRYGHAVVHYDDDPPGTGQHHSIRMLEQRVPAR
jgi:hypothetical protein